jgi:hypothetical protein
MIPAQPHTGTGDHARIGDVHGAAEEISGARTDPLGTVGVDQRCQLGLGRGGAERVIASMTDPRCLSGHGSGRLLRGRHVNQEADCGQRSRLVEDVVLVGDVLVVPAGQASASMSALSVTNRVTATASGGSSSGSSGAHLRCRPCPVTARSCAYRCKQTCRAEGAPQRLLWWVVM